MRINISAGHNPAGKVGCGAVSILNESRENRIVKNEVVRQLRLLGHTVYDCTVDDGANQSDILAKCVTKCNQHDVDLDVQIHFNCGVNDRVGNGKTTGTECYIYSEKSLPAKNTATNIVNAIAKLGFKNRGVKIGSKLYFLRNTKAQAVLIECCFVDDADDAKLYDAQAMADAIVFGITGQKWVEPIITVEAKAEGDETVIGDSNALYRVQVGAYRNRENAELLQQKIKEAGYDCFITKA